MKKNATGKASKSKRPPSKKGSKSLKERQPKVTKVENDFIDSIKELYVEDPIDVYACQYSDPTSFYTSPSPYTC